MRQSDARVRLCQSTFEALLLKFQLLVRFLLLQLQDVGHLLVHVGFPGVPTFSSRPACRHPFRRSRPPCRHPSRRPFRRSRPPCRHPSRRRTCCLASSDSVCALCLVQKQLQQTLLPLFSARQSQTLDL